MKKAVGLTAALIVAIFLIIYKNHKAYISNDLIKDSITKDYFSQGPKKNGLLFVNGKKLEYELTVNEELQNYILKILKRFRTPYSAVVVIDNETSKILALAGYSHKFKNKYDELTLSSTNPGASLFKIITSAALLETGKVGGNDPVFYNGKGTTLYKSQLKNKKNRWTRKINLKRAFAYSNNVVFGKLSQRYLTPKSLLSMAERFKFNSGILNVIQSPISKYSLATSDYQVAEFGSGFNKVNTISPLHAAYLSSVVANAGVRKNLSLINSITIDDEKINLIRRKLVDQNNYKIYSNKTATELKSFMLETVRRGTARGVGQILRKSLKKKLSIGAKTGSITGGFPEGKREWVTAFATPKDERKGKGISIAVVNILNKKWYVRSSYIAKKVIEYYFSKIDKI